MRELQSIFVRELNEDDKQRFNRPSNVDRVYDTVESVVLSDIEEGERVIVRDTLKSYTKIDGSLEEV